MFAIRDQILTSYGFSRLIQNAPSLYQTLSDSIVTNMTLEEMLSLAASARDIEREQIRTGVIDSNYVIGHVTENGAQVLIPRRDAISGLLYEVFWLENAN